LVVRVAGNEVGRERAEVDEATLGAEARGEERLAVGIGAVGRLADPLGDPGLTVVDEDVGCEVVVRDDVVCVGQEGDEAPVPADVGLGAARIRLRAASGDADPRRLTREAIADEDIGRVVPVAANEVRRL
jgi:hypothetical protein